MLARASQRHCRRTLGAATSSTLSTSSFINNTFNLANFAQPSCIRTPRFFNAKFPTLPTFTYENIIAYSILPLNHGKHSAR